jgi:hypothetical protein
MICQLQLNKIIYKNKIKNGKHPTNIRKAYTKDDESCETD